ncbi:hypothetical protein RND71_035087 [Anisodus tanguticus]|uniref:Uncharacterized protein n=1 Tax=Anisodus tanguticus TaxID=243964 RepID=A0AAE1R4C6_9SOLA|nr:hypothetical protein RND71_035087 [Anisodus tanguticus]
MVFMIINKNIQECKDLQNQIHTSITCTGDNSRKLIGLKKSFTTEDLFINDMHALISPNAPRTPLTLILLGKAMRMLPQPRQKASSLKARLARRPSHSMVPTLASLLVRFMIASANLIPWALADVFHSSPGP